MTMPQAGALNTVAPLMDTLLNQNATGTAKIEAYKTLAQQLRNNDAADAFGPVESKSTIFLKSLLKDGAADKTDLAQAALQVLGVCLHENQFTSNLSAATINEVLTSLCDIIKASKDKTSCTRGLWCLSTQTLSPAALQGHIPKLISVVEYAMLSGSARSPIVEHESVNVIIRLLEQCPGTMEIEAVKWAKLMYPMLVHNAAKVRERALIAMEQGIPLILRNPAHQEVISGDLVQDLKVRDFGTSRFELLLSEMAETLKKPDPSVQVSMLKAWMVFVKILGKRLHSGGFLNKMLPIVEAGFKTNKQERTTAYQQFKEVRIAAYQAWKVLIDCFSLNKDILEDAKRVKLIMQVFRITRAVDEVVAVEKFCAWWHYVVTIRPSTPSMFDQVVEPLFKFCLGDGKSGPVTPAKGVSPSTPGRTPLLKRNASGGFTSPPTPSSSLNSSGTGQFVFKVVQLKGLEALTQLLGSGVNPNNLPRAEFTIEKMHGNLVDQQIFMKHGVSLINTVRDLLYAVGNDAQDGILYCLWYSLVARLKSLLEHGSRKDNVDIFMSVLTRLQDIVSSQAISANKILRIIEMLSNLPDKVLSSPAYNVGTLTSSAVMQGCPASTLIDLLFQEGLLDCTKEERYFVVMEKLIRHGITNPVGALGFLQTCLTSLEGNADRLATDILWRMWSVIVNPLLDHIMKTNEVNQGDALEHNFMCLYKALEFPLVRLLSDDLHQGSLKSMFKTWTELYTTFARLAAMVPNAEANVCCEELCEKIIASALQKTKNVIGVEYLAAVCKVMVDTLDFSSLTQPNMISPIKFGKKKHKSLGNLHNLVKLVSETTEALHTLVSGETGPFGNKKSPDLANDLIAPANDLTHVMSQLFNHLPTSSMILATLEKFASPVADLLNGAAKRSSKLYTQQFQQKLEKLWLDISTCIQGRYTGGFDSDFLAVVSPLLSAVFLHPRRPIKNQAVILWNATFAQSQPLNYPDSLVPVLTKVKEKTPIVLPGWTSKDVSVIDDAPVSQMSQAGESNAPVPNVIGIPSPHKAHGSFMNRVVSPNIKKSPMLSPKGPRNSPKPTSSPGPARRKIPMAALQDLNSSDFVVIKSSPKKKMVLTEHQREKMKEQRGTVPALYSSVDNSMDVSLMGQFMSTDSQSQHSSTPTPTPPVSFAPFKFPTSTAGEIKRKNSEKKMVEKVNSMEDLTVSEDETDTRSRRRSTRKSVRFSTESEEGNKSQDPDTVNSEEAMDTTPGAPQEQEYDSFGFMTPSGDSVKSSESAEKPDGEVNGTGDHKQDEESKVVSKDASKDDVEMMDTDLTVAEELSEAAKLSPSKANASKLKDFVLGCQDSDASRDVPSDNDSDIVEIISQKKADSEGKANINMDGARTRNKSLFSVESNEDVSSLEKDDPDKVRGRRTRRSVAAASPVRSSPRTRGTPKRNNEGAVSDRPFRRSVSDPAARVCSEESDESVPSSSAPVEILVEDSQQFSPSKFKAKLCDTIVEDSQQFSPSKRPSSKKKNDSTLILDFSGAFDSSGSGKNLFSQDTFSSQVESKLPEHAETPEFSTPTKRPPAKDVASPTSPVVKLYKLSQEDIIRLSPAKQATNDGFIAPEIGDTPKSVGRGLKKRASLLRASKAASQDKKSEESSSGNKVNMDDIIPSSQDAFAFALQNSLSVAETQFTPKMLSLNKDSDNDVSIAELPEESKSENESALKEVSDMEATVIEKDLPEDSDELESDPKDRHKAKNKAGSEPHTSDSFNESAQDSRVSSTSGSGFMRNPDIVPADIDMSRDSDDSQATIVSSRVKRRKSKRILDELKGQSELPNSESSEQSQSQPSQPRRRGRSRKKVLPQSQGDDSPMSTDGQKLDESSDADSSFSEASDTSKGSTTKGDYLKSKLAIATMEDDMVSSQEMESESLVSSDPFKVPKVPDDKSAPEVVEINESVEESDYSVVCLGDDREPEPKERGKTSVKIAGSSQEKDEVDSDSSQSSQRGRTLRSRKSKSQESQDTKIDSVENENQETKNDGNDSSDEDDDVPLRQLSSKPLGKSPAKSESDADDDTPLSLFLSRSESIETPKSSGEEAKTSEKENTKEEEAMVIEDTAPQQSCVDMFADSAEAIEENKSEKLSDDKVETEITQMSEAVAGENATKEGIKEDNVTVKFVRPGRGRRGKMSLDSRKRKSPKTSPKDSSLRKTALRLRRKASSPVVAISPLSKMNKAIVEKQLSQILNEEKDAESDQADGSSKVEVVDMKADDSNIKTFSKENETIGEGEPPEKKSMGTLQSLNKGVSKSPPKKGKPFDTPETPTSASKFTSRSQYILERSRKICLAKASSPLLSSRKLLVPKKSPRSILKNTPTVKSPEKSNGPLAALHNSPQASKLPTSSESPPTFRPIQIPKIYSPSASPSAGILKKRRLSGDTPVDSPSPPNKQRRVAFNDDLDVCELESSHGQSSPSKPINRCLEMGSRGHVPSPLVASSPSQTSTNSTKFFTTMSKSTSEKRNKDQDGFTIPDSVTTKKTDDSQSEDSCLSTQNVSQLNSKDPVYPDLVDCDASVDDILPQLTSTMWVRGLGQLVRAKNIRTVGKLAALTETEINSLPIRNPKITTTRSALAAFAEQWTKKTDKQAAQSTSDESAKSEVIVNGAESPEKEALPSADEVLDVSPIKCLDFDTSMTSDQDDDPLSSLKENNNSTETLNTAGEVASRVLAAVNSTSNVAASPIKSPTRKKLLKDLKELKSRMSPAVLSQVPSHQLVEMHQQLNEMMTSVVFALKSKCAASPQVSQSSQSDSE